MLTGMQHLHQSMAYLVFLAAILGLVMVVAGASRKPKLARVTNLLHRFGLLMLGRLVLLLGIGLVIPLGYSYATMWVWLSILLWVPVEITGKRFVKAELATVMGGDSATNKLMMGAAIQLVCVVAIFGLMSVRP